MKLILLNGPSSAGKSSVAKQLKDRLQAEIVALDDFLPDNLEEPLWEDDVYELMPEMCRRIREHFSRGADVIVDHVITSRRIYDMLLSAAEGQAILKVLVSCDLEVLKERENLRGNRYRGAAELTLEYLYPKTGYDLRIDTGRLSSGEAADRIAACALLT